MARLTVNLLGAPRIELDDAPITLDTRKAVALLAYLLMTAERHTRDTLATLLWPEYDQSRGRAALRRTLSTLKTAVDGYGLDIERDALAIDEQADIWVDALEFRTLLSRCGQHGHRADEVCPACQAPLGQAVALYQDDFMSGFTLRDSPDFDEWQYLQSEGLRRELASALRSLIRCLQVEGQYEQAIEQAHRWLSLDPLHEPAHRELMTLLAASGQRSTALRQYRECVRILDEELGVPPLEETTALYERILAGELSDEPAAMMTVAAAPEPKADAADQPATGLTSLPMVGRAAEWRQLQQWHQAVNGGGRLAIIEGEAGIGKTRLAEAFLAELERGGALLAAARCYEGETLLAYGPVAEALRGILVRLDDRAWLAEVAPHWLSEAARLLPELHRWQPQLPAPPPLDSPGAQSRFFEGISQLLGALSRYKPGSALFLDDLHWADEATLTLLIYLTRRLHDRPLFILVTWRGEQLPTDHRLRQLLADAQRAGTGRLLKLRRLNQDQVTELVRGRLEAPDVQKLAQNLYRETEGLPFFIAEYLAVLASGQTDMASMPINVRDLLRSRLAAVDETGWQLLNTAAVIGRSFDFDTLRLASGRAEEETVSGLESLIELGLVEERRSDDLAGPDDTGAIRYDFGHAKLRRLVYEQTSLARRRLLHRRVAEALVSHGEGGSGAAQVAHHYRSAGSDEQAAHYFSLAGDEARALYANAEALAHYANALALGHPDTMSLHEASGDLNTLLGHYNAALTSYEAAAALVEPDQDGQLGRIEHKLGNVYQRQGDWELAASHYRQALSRLDAAEARARIMADWSLAVHLGGDSQQASTLAQEAMVLAETAGDIKAAAQAHNILGILSSHAEQLDQATYHLEQSLALAHRLADPGIRVAALNNLASAAQMQGEMDKARAYLEEALTLCRAQGDRHREAALLNNLADLDHATGRPDAAMIHLKQAVSIYAEIGGDPSEWRPEIWKLTEW